jgi:hypothetical protein
MVPKRGPGLSAILAMIALLIEVAEFIGEATGFKKAHTEIFDFASFVSLVLFGVSIVLWLESSQKQLRKVDQIAERLEEIKKEIDNVDRIARYGSGGVWLTRLLKAGSQVHGQAGGATLADVLLDVYTTAAEDLHRLTTGSKDRVELFEYHVVDKFLLNLMRALPPNSVWLGVTRLQSTEAWSKQSAEASYLGFQELVETRTREKSIAFFRLWSFDGVDGAIRAEPILNLQREAGLQLRVAVASDAPDMSLIWIPKSQNLRKSSASVDLEGLFARLIKGEEFEPVCGIEFKTRNGKELDGMTIYSPDSDAFAALRFRFKQSWDRARPAPAALGSGAPASHSGQ